MFALKTTKAITKILLIDSFEIEMAERHGDVAYKKRDVERIGNAITTIGYGEWNEVHGIKWKFIDAGHIPGSASIMLKAEGKTVLVFAGSGHVVFGLGIPNRLYRRTSVPYQTIVLKAWKEKIDEDFTFAGSASPLANFLWITQPNPPEKKQPRIGVILKQQKEDQKGLWIEKVIPGSPAEKAGLLPGDQFLVWKGKRLSRSKTSTMPWLKKVYLLIRNNWIKIKNFQSCCGHPGEPGC
jgi:hypothetical protein